MASKRKELEAAPSVLAKVEETIASLDLGPEDAGIAGIARYLAGVIDSAEQDFEPIDLDWEEEHADARQWAVLKLRIYKMQLHVARVRAVEKVMPSLLVAMKEMGGTPGARQRAAALPPGGDSDADELGELRAARRAG